MKSAVLIIFIMWNLEPTTCNKTYNWKKQPKPKEFLPPKPVIVAPMLVRQKQRRLRTHVYHGGPLTSVSQQMDQMTGGPSIFQPPVSSSSFSKKIFRNLSANPQIYFNNTQVDVPELTDAYRANIEQDAPLKISEGQKLEIQGVADGERNSLHDVLVSRINTLNEDIRNTVAQIGEVNGQINDVFGKLGSQFTTVEGAYHLKDLGRII